MKSEACRRCEGMFKPTEGRDSPTHDLCLFCWLEVFADKDRKAGWYDNEEDAPCQESDARDTSDDNGRGTSPDGCAS